MSYKDEVLSIINLQEWHNDTYSKQYSIISKMIVDYAEEWGKKMQYEMKQCNSILTDDIVNLTEKTLNNLYIDVGRRHVVMQLLVTHWEHGEDLARILGFRLERGLPLRYTRTKRQVDAPSKTNER